jgi:ribosomal protein L29
LARKIVLRRSSNLKTYSPYSDFGCRYREGVQGSAHRLISTDQIDNIHKDVREPRRRVARHVVVERQAKGRTLEQGLEPFLTPLERQVARILTVELEQIEGPTTNAWFSRARPRNRSNEATPRARSSIC